MTQAASVVARAVAAILAVFLTLAVEAAGLPELSQNATWLRLLHYQKPLAGTMHSAIHSPEFFLSTTGNTDSLAELKATLQAMLEPATAGHEDEHAKCRFPARRIWISKQIPELKSQLGELPCPAMLAWVDPASVGSISLIFANGYLGNPASYYGHLFFKFNTSNAGSSYLVDHTANYGALDVQGANPFVYIVKALVGGYDGGFSAVDFYYQDAIYTENEFRDLWEYRLNLDPEELKFLMTHAWEVHQKRYTYYFFHDNCAFRVAEILEILDGVQATPANAPWVIPQAVVQQVMTQSRRGQPLVLENKVFLSRPSRLYQRYEALDGKQRSLLHALVDKTITLEALDLQAESKQGQAKIIDTLLDYYQFAGGTVSSSGERSLPVEYTQALAARMALPPASESLLQHPAESPDAAHKPGWIQLGTGHQDAAGELQTLRIRPAYYDWLDGGAAQAPLSALSMGDLTLERVNERIQIKRLDFVSIDSVNPSVTGLPGDGGMGWRGRIGLEKRVLPCQDCLTLRMQGDYFKVFHLPLVNLPVSIGLGAGLQSNTQNDGTSFVRFGANFTKKLNNGIGIRVSDELRQSTADSTAVRSMTLEIRKPLSKDFDLRLLYEQELVSRTTFGIGAYW